MTFGAMAGWQALVLAAAACGLAAWLFFLRLRPPRVLVPSLLLWRRVLDEPSDVTLWDRIRRVVSLIVTVLVALALALAISRPSRGLGVGAAAASRGRLLIVVDSSWSMLAQTRSGETRWARAAAEVRRLAAAASGDEVTLATTADGLVEGPTSDLALIEASLDRLAPTGGKDTGWPRVAGTDSVHFITDGVLARPLDAGVIVHSVFESAPNVGVTALEVRPSMSRGGAGDVYLEVANFSAAAQRVHITLIRGDATIFDRQIDMGAGEAIHQAAPLARGGDARLRAHIEAAQNALSIDDDAFAWIDRASPLAITVVGSSTGWLNALLAHDPDVRATFVEPAGYHPGQEDVVIFDRWAPPDRPIRPVLCLAPPATAWLGAIGPEERKPRWLSAGSHPVVRGVDPFTMVIEKARPYLSQELTPIAQSEHGTPLVYVRETADRRLVVVTFGMGESNLTTAPGFPVLIGDALDWLTRPVPAGTRRPGPMSFDAAIAKVTGPSGSTVPLRRVGQSAVGVLAAPGLYVVESGGARSTIAVNVGDPQVSNLERTSLNAAQQAAPVTAGASGRAWWLYCVEAAFLLALAEWWTWQRRITV